MDEHRAHAGGRFGVAPVAPVAPVARVDPDLPEILPLSLAEVAVDVTAFPWHPAVGRRRVDASLENRQGVAHVVGRRRRPAEVHELRLAPGIDAEGDPEL